MNPTDLWPALVALLLALGTTWVLSRRSPLPEARARYRSIDGLRGYLAFGVFLHHATLWQSYRVSGAWAYPPSAFYVNAGKGSVALFFMITAFLFFGRLLDARTRRIDWARLFLGRLMRLTPAYLLMLFLMLTLVAVLTRGRLQVETGTLLGSLKDWLLFTIPGRPDVNGLARTEILVAGVTWSLPYEWMFYAALPVLMLMLGGRPGVRPLMVPVVAGVLLLVWRPSLGNLMPFAVGIAAAFAARWRPLQHFAHTPLASALTLTSLVGGFALPMSAVSPLPQMLQAFAFVLIACGNDLFGGLSSRLSRHFGEPTYSVYLLHGLVLFVSFHWCVAWMTGVNAAQLSATQHWLVVWMMTPVLMTLSHCSHRYVEMPGLALTEPWLQRIRATAVWGASPQRP
ncbi:acyltransferase family protein [Roseateles terrae]|uniref:Peptidoglycan/LPS O-acetylase OafA/YrhL n=1 Tax=Roseateles terrae TaxID=431060 RepID=A0ABR6GTN1_9BURK|nr:acyltransferase [Roseateles terrae]MBB3195076.1 peptidoglycan/LPS O-acetylase OafA/YrhL [Roseateles terrae]